MPLDTTFADTSVNGVSVSGQLTATVPAAFITNPGFAVVTLGPGGSPAVFTIAAAGGSANLLSIPHIADGAGWTTTFAIQNIDTVPATFNLSFWADDGTALPLTVQSAGGTPGTLSGSLYPGHSYFLQSPGTSASLLEGWAQVGSSGQLGVMAIFNYTAPGIPASQGTVIGSTSASAISMPYDNTGGYIMGIALANANPTQALTVSLSFLTDQGAQSTGQVTVPAHGHLAFVLATQFPATANTRGTIQFTTTTPDLSVLGERFTPSLSFTTLGTFE